MGSTTQIMTIKGLEAAAEAGLKCHVPSDTGGYYEKPQLADTLMRLSGHDLLGLIREGLFVCKENDDGKA